MKTEDKKIKIGRAPLEGYKYISQQELNELRKLSVREAARRLEILLKVADTMSLHIR